MDRSHEFMEDVDDGSMCVCGIPASAHDAWERKQTDQSDGDS